MNSNAVASTALARDAFGPTVAAIAPCITGNSSIRPDECGPPGASSGEIGLERARSAPWGSDAGLLRQLEPKVTQPHLDVAVAAAHV